MLGAGTRADGRIWIMLVAFSVTPLGVGEAVAAKAPRVSVTLKADIRPGIAGALDAKVEAVERYLEP